MANEREVVASAIAEFPETFILKGWPSEKLFRIADWPSSYVPADKARAEVQLVVQVQFPDKSWKDFSRTTAAQLRCQIAPAHHKEPELKSDCNCIRFYDGSPHHKNCPQYNGGQSDFSKGTK